MKLEGAVYKKVRSEGEIYWKRSKDRKEQLKITKYFRKTCIENIGNNLRSAEWNEVSNDDYLWNDQKLPRSEKNWNCRYLIWIKN